MAADAVTLCIIAFTEAIFSAFPGIDLSFGTTATLTNIDVCVCVFIGAGWTIRIQYGILAVLLLSIGSFFVGAWNHNLMETLTANLQARWTDDHSLFTIFALFFPAVTGIMAIIYAGIAILLAAANRRSVLTGDGFVMMEITWSGGLIYAGVISATLSSALGSMMDAPRILQAFAQDYVFKWLRWTGRGSGVPNEPRRATVITFLIAQAGIMAGELDTIAPIITMFFSADLRHDQSGLFCRKRNAQPQLPSDV